MNGFGFGEDIDILYESGFLQDMQKKAVEPNKILDLGIFKHSQAIVP